MSDNKQWTKLWTNSLTDLVTANFSNELYGFWARLQLITSKEGTAGVLNLPRSAPATMAQLHVTDESALLAMISALHPIVSVTVSERYISVTFPKWHKYQVDSSAERVRKFREKHQNRNGVPSLSLSVSSIPNKSILNEAKTRASKNGKKPFPEVFTVTDEHRKLATEISGKFGIPIDADLEAAGFRDYCLSNGVQYSNYDAAFRNRIRNAPKFASKKQSSPQSLFEKNRENSRRAIELLRTKK